MGKIFKKINQFCEDHPHISGSIICGVATGIIGAIAGAAAGLDGLSTSTDNLVTGVSFTIGPADDESEVKSKPEPVPESFGKKPEPSSSKPYDPFTGNYLHDSHMETYLREEREHKERLARIEAEKARYQQVDISTVNSLRQQIDELKAKLEEKQNG